MRFREDGPQELARARAAVMDWRDRNPAGTAWQLAAELGGQFHPDYGPVLRALLFAADRHRARITTGAADRRGALRGIDGGLLPRNDPVARLHRFQGEHPEVVFTAPHMGGRGRYIAVVPPGSIPGERREITKGSLDLA